MKQFFLGLALTLVGTAANAQIVADVGHFQINGLSLAMSKAQADAILRQRICVGRIDYYNTLK
jgi:hypothetical protein